MTHLQSKKPTNVQEKPHAHVIRHEMSSAFVSARPTTCPRPQGSSQSDEQRTPATQQPPTSHGSASPSSTPRSSLPTGPSQQRENDLRARATLHHGFVPSLGPPSHIALGRQKKQGTSVCALKPEWMKIPRFNMVRGPFREARRGACCLDHSLSFKRLTRESTQSRRCALTTKIIINCYK